MLTVEGSVHQGACLHSLLNVFVLICGIRVSTPGLWFLLCLMMVVLFVFCALNWINLIPHKVRVCVWWWWCWGVEGADRSNCTRRRRHTFFYKLMKRRDAFLTKTSCLSKATSCVRGSIAFLQALPAWRCRRVTLRPAVIHGAAPSLVCPRLRATSYFYRWMSRGQISCSRHTAGVSAGTRAESGEASSVVELIKCQCSTFSRQISWEQQDVSTVKIKCRPKKQSY